MSDQGGEQHNPWPAAVAELRAATGLTVRAFATYLRVNPSSITRWQGGRVRPQGLQRDVLLERMKEWGITIDDDTDDRT